MVGKAEISWRSFLIFVGGAISVLTLPYDHVIALETRWAVVELIESSYEKDRKMKNRLLIVYGSRYAVIFTLSCI